MSPVALAGDPPNSGAAAHTVTTSYALLFGLAMFVASNIVSLPVGFVSGFREARKQPLSRRAATILEIIESAAEIAVWVAITLVLIHRVDGDALLNIALAYGLMIMLEAIALRVLKLSSPSKWLRVLAAMSVAILISIALA